MSLSLQKMATKKPLALQEMAGVKTESLPTSPVLPEGVVSSEPIPEHLQRTVRQQMERAERFKKEGYHPFASQIPIDIGRAGAAAMRASRIDRLIPGSKERAIAAKQFLEKKKWHEKFPEAAGAGLEAYAELLLLAPVLSKMGVLSKLPKGATFTDKAFETAKLFGGFNLTKELRDVVTGDYEGGGAIRTLTSMVWGAVISMAVSGVGAVWSKLRPVEQDEALKLLGLKKGASEQEIRRAAQKLAMKTHPDKVVGQVNQFKKIMQARDELLKKGGKFKDVVYRGKAPVSAPKLSSLAKRPQPKPPSEAAIASPKAKMGEFIDFREKPLNEWGVRVFAQGDIGKKRFRISKMPDEKSYRIAEMGYGEVARFDNVDEAVDALKEGVLQQNEFVFRQDKIGFGIRPKIIPSEITSETVAKWAPETKPPVKAPIAPPKAVEGKVGKEYVVVRRKLPEGKIRWEAYNLEGERLASAPRITGKGSISDKFYRRKGVYQEVAGFELMAEEDTKVTADWIKKHLASPKAVEAKPKGKVSKKMAKGFVDLSPIADAGEQVRTTADKLAKATTRFTGLEPKLRQTLIKYEENVREIPKIAATEAIKKFGKLTEAQETAIRNHQEQPLKYDLPKELLKPYTELVVGQNKAGKILEEMGYPADWPNTYIKRMEAKLKRLQARKEPDPILEEVVRESIREAKGLRYLHHFYKNISVGKRIRRWASKAITKKPRALLGRKIPTLEKAAEIGLEPAPLAVSYAHMMDSALRAQAANELIKAVNNNPNLSLPEDKAPADWVRLDERIFPATVQRLAWIESGKPVGIMKFRKYPAPVADALEEIAYARGGHALERAYDKLNFALKIIGFYNPVIMTKNDLVQGWRATGLKYFPHLVKGLNTFIKKGAEYQKLREYGLFNNVVNYTPTAVQITENMLDVIRRGKTRAYMKRAKKWLNPITLLRDFNEATTWNMDEIMRIACYNGIKNTSMAKGLSDFEVVEMANDFMVNYGKTPKELKRWLNKAFFVPTYRIGNLRVFWGRMARHPWRYKGPLLRTIAYKMFIWTALPAIVAAAIKWATNRKVAVKTERGYRLVIHNPETNKDTVYALSDPLLEGAKLTQRPLLHSLSLNLAPLPSLLVRLMNGPRWKNSKDPFGEFFKLGTPIYRDIVNWTDKDKTIPQKILTQLAIAYVYTRSHREADKETANVAFAKALSIWTDWKMQKESLQTMVTGRRPKKSLEDEEAKRLRGMKL